MHNFLSTSTLISLEDSTRALHVLAELTAVIHSEGTASSVYACPAMLFAAERLQAALEQPCSASLLKELQGIL